MKAKVPGFVGGALAEKYQGSIDLEKDFACGNDALKQEMEANFLNRNPPSMSS